MLRLSEEQRAILGCYSELIEEARREIILAIPFIEDLELREMTESLLVQIEKMEDVEFTEILRSGEGEAGIESAE